MSEQGFVKTPGRGILTYRMSGKDVQTKREAKLDEEGKPVPMVHIWHGYVTVSTGRDVELRVSVSTRAKTQHVEVHDYKTWRKISEFNVPVFGDFDYVDGVMPLDGREYKVRFIKNEEQGNVRVRLPQVLRADQARHAFV